MNLYSYCHSNPLRYIDPSGNTPVLVWDETNRDICVPLMMILYYLVEPFAETPYKFNDSINKISDSNNESDDSEEYNNDNEDDDSEVKFPKDPSELQEDGWQDVTPEGMKNKTDSREFYNPNTGETIRFDKGKEGANGFEGVDHYHRYNPNSTGKSDQYLDKYGKPVRRGSKPSHILP